MLLEERVAALEGVAGLAMSSGKNGAGRNTNVVIQVIILLALPIYMVELEFIPKYS